jgi:hypothetical protein
LKEKIEKYFTSKFSDKNILGVTISDNNKAIEATLINAALSVNSFQFLKRSVPLWVKELCDKEIKEAKKDKKFVYKFLESYKLPEVGMRYVKELTQFRRVLSRFLDDIKDNMDEEDFGMADLHARDLQDLTKVFMAVKSGNIGYAKRYCRDLDTSPRECIPDCVYNGIVFKEGE